MANLSMHNVIEIDTMYTLIVTTVLHSWETGITGGILKTHVKTQFIFLHIFIENGDSVLFKNKLVTS